ncbi:hypothetical protein Leryth_012410 [Lithospermum erythrorhizon]|nr:hypothetical protein Leryth_012410 [Lithospermum erythrorhizon]
MDEMEFFFVGLGNFAELLSNPNQEFRDLYVYGGMIVLNFRCLSYTCLNVNVNVNLDPIFCMVSIKIFSIHSQLSLELFWPSLVY